MKRTRPRIPEGGAIENSPGITMERYSEIMKKHLGREYLRFADNVIKKVAPAENSTIIGEPQFLQAIHLKKLVLCLIRMV